MNAYIKFIGLVLGLQVALQPLVDVVRMLMASEFARTIFLCGIGVGLIVPVVVPKIVSLAGLLRLYISAIPARKPAKKTA